MQLDRFISKNVRAQNCNPVSMLKYVFGTFCPLNDLAKQIPLKPEIVLFVLQVVKLLRDAYDRVKALLKEVRLTFEL